MRTRLISSSDPVSSQGHRPVLLHEVVRALDVQPDDVVVDATLGGGGHTKELVRGLGEDGLFIGFDMDADAIERTRQVLERSAVPIRLIQANFRDLASELEKCGVKRITKILFDLGWSSYQLDSGLPGQGRGFSFQADEPLRMTYAKDAELTAEQVVNTWSEESLADVIYGFGEERYARRIAKAIVKHRQAQPLRASRELAEIIYSSVPASYRHGKIHPATRTFQALRIAVNDELGALSEGLRAAWSILRPGGRIAVISFHSIEDRIVKRTFLEWEKRNEGQRLNKRVVRPSKEEVAKNPRARSAKLRVIQKVQDSPDAQGGRDSDRSVGKKISYESSYTKDKQIRPLDFSGEN